MAAYAVGIAAAGLLLIAMPQSSSTSTAAELAHMAGVNNTQEVRLPCHNRTLEFGTLSVQELASDHTDVCSEYEEERLRRWVLEETIVYKQHIPPSSRVLDMLRRILATHMNSTVAILLRDPSNSTNAKCTRFVVKKDTMSTITAVGDHVAALRDFADGWKAAAARLPHQLLVFSYEEMLSTAQGGLGRAAVLERVLRHMRMPHVEPFSEYRHHQYAQQAGEKGRQAVVACRRASVRAQALIAWRSAAPADLVTSESVHEADQ